MLQAQRQGPHTGGITLHYLDDFMVVGGNKEKVGQVTAHGIVLNHELHVNPFQP